MAKKSVTNLGISRVGSDINVFDDNLCNVIREKLNMTKKQLSNKSIKKALVMSNTMIGEWLLNNPEGFMLEWGYTSKKPFGVLAISKHLPKEFRDDKDEMVESIKTLQVSDILRKILLKRYDVNIDKTIDFNKIMTLKEKVPHLNLNTFFYKYRFMWFNKKNCSSRKADAYRFRPSVTNNSKLSEKIFSGKDYYEWNFSDFYRHKVKSKF
jgi:hypothetical protein